MLTQPTSVQNAGLVEKFKGYVFTVMRKYINTLSVLFSLTKLLSFSSILTFLLPSFLFLPFLFRPLCYFHNFSNRFIASQDHSWSWGVSLISNTCMHTQISDFRVEFMVCVCVCFSNTIIPQTPKCYSEYDRMTIYIN